MRDLSVFIAETLSPRDLYLGRLDGFAANEVLKIQRVRSRHHVVINRAMLSRAIREAAAGKFGVFHLSSHGDEDGIRLTDGSDVDWPELAELLGAFASPGRLLVMSSCSGGYVGFSKALEKRRVAFGCIFGSTARKGVGYTDACLAWSVLYNRLVEHGAGRAELRSTLDKINGLVPGDFVYRRWNGERYLTYPTFKPGRHRPTLPITS